MTKKVEFRGLLPYLYYEDAGAMLDWLSRVFGFEERGRYVDKDGIVRQAEMLVGENELWFSGRTCNASRRGTAGWRRCSQPRVRVRRWLTSPARPCRSRTASRLVS